MFVKENPDRRKKEYDEASGYTFYKQTICSNYFIQKIIAASYAKVLISNY